VARLAARLEQEFAAYRFNDVANLLYQFVWGSVCDWYLEFTKPILAGGDAAAQAETRATTAWVLDRILLLLHPVMPYVTEELREQLTDGRGAPLITSDWPAFDERHQDAAAAAEMGWVVRLVSDIRAIRSEMNVPAGAEVPLLVKDAGADTERRLATHGDLIRRLARLASIELLAGDPPAGSAQTVIDEATVVLPLAGAIDLDRERARLSKEVTKLAGEIARIEKKLGNADFMAKAPEEIVEEQRERQADATLAKTKLEAALARIAAA
jgi:valyl-tRNA synthetase